MLSALSQSDFQSLSEVRSPFSPGKYRAFIDLQQLITLPIYGESRWTAVFVPGTTDTPEDLYIEDVMKTQALMHATHKWQRFVFDPSAPVDVDAITETIESVFDAMEAYGPDYISLQGLTANHVQGEHLAAVLRATFALRDQVPGWAHGLQVAENALTAAGENPNDALFGLIGRE